MLKKISIIACILLSAVLAGGVWSMWQNDMQQSAHNADIDIEARPLRLQINDLENQMKDLEEEYEIKMKGTASVQLVFVELDEALYTDAYPLMEDIPGVLALSDTDFFGTEGNITRSQFDELLNAGWSYCLNWDGKDNLRTWLTVMQGKLQNAGLEMPDTLYFAAESYSSKMDAILEEYGIKTAVHHGEESLPLITTAEDETDSNLSAAIWRPGSKTWNYSGVKDEIARLIHQKGNLAFTISFRQEDDIQKDDIWEETQFTNILSCISDYIKSGDLLATDFSSARIQHVRDEDELSALTAELEAQKAALQEQIDQLQQQLDALYAS